VPATTKIATNPASPLVMPSREIATTNSSASGLGSAARRWSPVSTRTSWPRAAARTCAASVPAGSPGRAISASASIRPRASPAATASLAYIAACAVVRITPLTVNRRGPAAVCTTIAAPGRSRTGAVSTIWPAARGGPPVTQV
jgi:hypothetical protein